MLEVQAAAHTSNHFCLLKAKAMQRSTGQQVTIKLYKHVGSDPYQLRRLLREMIAMRKLSKESKNMFVVKCLDVIIPEASTRQLYHAAKHFRKQKDESG